MTQETHTERLLKYLLKGRRIADFEGYAKIRVPNIRSRVCDLQRSYGLIVERERAKPHRYNRYWLEPCQIQKVKRLGL